MSDIIREVDEELRREDWENVWKRYGGYVIGAAVAIVVGTAAVTGWREYDSRQKMAAGDAFATVVEKVETSGLTPAQGADALAAYSVGAPAGYSVLARFREAKLRADAGDRQAAIALYDRLSADTGVDSMFRELAVLYSVRMQVGEGDSAALTARLEPLAGAGSPWRYSARELKAVLALAAGDTVAAKAGFATLADDLDAPQQLRARAAEMLRAVGP